MAMTECAECKAAVSDAAKTCPKCGAPMPKKTSAATKIMGGIFIAFMAAVVYESSKPEAPTPQLTPAQKAAEAKKEAEFQQVRRVAASVKAAAKNPASFDLIYAGVSDDGAVCLQYRATNSFNAIVPGQYAHLKSISSGAASAWNKLCGGKMLTNYTHVRRSL